MLEARAVTKIYETRGVETVALRDVTLTIEAGEFTALAGPSGSGKTTLLNLYGALDVPTRGEILLEGEALHGLSPSELAQRRLQKLGFIFQAYNLIPVLSARENVEFVMELQGVRPAERKERAMGVLGEVGLGDLADKRPLEMSGGQQQRVAVARAIVSEPRVVLADEPTANLDSRTAEGLLDLMHEMNRRHGVTFLFSTHDPMVIEKSQRRVRLRDGQIVADESLAA
ncbi:MAG: macrolide ABC transporter ATP-binding protein [Deltaproteobacteria bacterium]|jgi:putative ABC transport system ATP-binding protein|nr:macrolide ABC transporter ATP-binding protein [Deltaproteobacteria bacterium]